MATDAFVQLQRLRCVTLKNTESRTEPYIWPALIQIDDTTLATNDVVAVISPALGSARVVIKDSMKAGDTADIPSPVGVLRARFDENLMTKRLLLVVALWEEDETPKTAMQAGFVGFLNELRAAIVDNLVPLSSAEGDELQQLIDIIKKRVEAKVRSAIENALSGWEKAKVFAGILNLDDPMGSDFAQFGKPSLVAKSFKLSFETRSKILNIESIAKYEIDGQLQLRPVTIDRCQSKVDAVNAALAVVRDFEQEIESLQKELQKASPAEKPFLISEIARVREEELPAAEAALAAARQALANCRARVLPDFSGAVLTQTR